MIALLAVPTLFIYGLVLVAAINVARGKWSRWALVLALLPFIDWAYEFVSSKIYFSGPDPIVASLHIVPAPAEIPTTLVIQDPVSHNAVFPSYVRKSLGITSIVFAKSGCDLSADNTSSPTGDDGIWGPSAPIPATYLLIKADVCARSDLPQYGGVAYYRELHLIAPGQDELIGAYSRRAIADPMFPPVLILTSWFGTLSEDIEREPEADMTNFVLTSLGRTGNGT